MTDESKSQKAEKPVENLELNRETLADLTEEQAERVGGGTIRHGTTTGCDPTWVTCTCVSCPVCPNATG
jgi:hypothetical protein